MSFETGLPEAKRQFLCNRIVDLKLSTQPFRASAAGDRAGPCVHAERERRDFESLRGTSKIVGIGIRTGDFLFVASGTGADVAIARFTIGNGSMNSDWFKLGSTEMGGRAAMSP
jgi:hypothetical protein